MTDEEKNQLIVENWKAAGPALQVFRDQEMRSMTDQQRSQAVMDVLSLPGNVKPCHLGRPEDESGLVIQQRIFSRAWK
ncbi:MAG: hypothetical protein ACFCUX_08195 [Candidatus Methylacidiphilales bacterium]